MNPDSTAKIVPSGAILLLQRGNQMKINDDLIEYIGNLSRLHLSDEEKDARKNDLSDILDYMEKLNEIDTEGLPEMTHPFEKNNRFREDEITNADSSGEMLSNAPDRKDNYFKVFKTVEE